MRDSASDFGQIIALLLLLVPALAGLDAFIEPAKRTADGDCDSDYNGANGNSTPHDTAAEDSVGGLNDSSDEQGSSAELSHWPADDRRNKLNKVEDLPSVIRGYIYCLATWYIVVLSYSAFISGSVRKRQEMPRNTKVFRAESMSVIL